MSNNKVIDFQAYLDRNKALAVDFNVLNEFDLGSQSFKESIQMKIELTRVVIRNCWMDPTKHYDPRWGRVHRLTEVIEQLTRNIILPENIYSSLCTVEDPDDNNYEAMRLGVYFEKDNDLETALTIDIGYGTIEPEINQNFDGNRSVAFRSLWIDEPNENNPMTSAHINTIINSGLEMIATNQGRGLWQPEVPNMVNLYLPYNEVACIYVSIAVNGDRLKYLETVKS